MENISKETIKRIIFIIKKFNKDINIKYLDLNNIASLEEFVKINGDFILQTIDFIEVYIDIFNKLNNLNIQGVEVPCSDIYAPEYLESLIGIYEKNNNNYIVKNILYNQIIVIYEELYKCKKDIFLINKILNIYYELLDIDDLDMHNKYIFELLEILDEDSDDGDDVSFCDLLNQFNITLKYSYGIKKKNVKVKVLKR